MPFPPCFHILKCQFLSPFPNICLTFCQPAEEEKQTPVNIVWQNKGCDGGMWSQRLLCLGAGGGWNTHSKEQVPDLQL